MTSFSVFAAPRSFAHPLPGNRVAQHACLSMVPQHIIGSRGRVTPSAGFILSRPCTAMGYGPNCKRCSTGLQWIRILNSSSERMAWFNQARTRSLRRRRSRMPRARAHLTRGLHPAFGPAPEMSVGRLGYCRAFTACLVQTQGLFTAFCTETYPDIHGFFTGLSRNICTGNPQASPLDHPPVFHKFSTGCRPTRPRANSRLASFCRETHHSL